MKVYDREYLDAFYSLSQARPSGFGGPEAIPVSDILSYVNLVGIVSREERLKYLRLIQRMDRAYLDHAREEAEKNKNKSGL